jgi:hypothetical protein
MLLPTTIDVIRAALKADPNPSAADRARLLAMMRTGSEPQTKSAPPDTGPRILRRKQAADRLGGRSLRWIDRLAQQGVLKKVKMPGRKRGCGFLESDINALLEQKVA